MRMNRILAGLTMTLLLLTLPAAASDYTLDIFGNANEDSTTDRIEATAWEDLVKLECVEHGLITGKYDRPSGVREYEPPKIPIPVVEPKLRGDICASYQTFGGCNDVYLGRVWCRTDTVSNLKDNAKEWHVLHQWGSATENCIVITRSGDTGVFGIFIEALGGYLGDWVYFPADHLISIGIRPDHSWGHRDYDEICFWVWDRTADEFWGKTYVLPDTEEIKAVDAALEQNMGEVPNSLWKNFHEFSPYDEDVRSVDLEDNFEWKEWGSPPCTNVNNEHVEEYHGWYGLPNAKATLWQRKTPE
jgi:hypothetical protein